MLYLGSASPPRLPGLALHPHPTPRGPYSEIAVVVLLLLVHCIADAIILAHTTLAPSLLNPEDITGAHGSADYIILGNRPYR